MPVESLSWKWELGILPALGNWGTSGGELLIGDDNESICKPESLKSTNKALEDQFTFPNCHLQTLTHLPTNKRESEWLFQAH